MIVIVLKQRQWPSWLSSEGHFHRNVLAHRHKYQKIRLFSIKSTKSNSEGTMKTDERAWAFCIPTNLKKNSRNPVIETIHVAQIAQITAYQNQTGSRNLWEYSRNSIGAYDTNWVEIQHPLAYFYSCWSMNPFDWLDQHRQGGPTFCFGHWRWRHCQLAYIKNTTQLQGPVEVYDLLLK